LDLVGSTELYENKAFDEAPIFIIRSIAKSCSSVGVLIEECQFMNPENVGGK